MQRTWFRDGFCHQGAVSDRSFIADKISIPYLCSCIGQNTNVSCLHMRGRCMLDIVGVLANLNPCTGLIAGSCIWAARRAASPAGRRAARRNRRVIGTRLVASSGTRVIGTPEPGPRPPRWACCRNSIPPSRRGRAGRRALHVHRAAHGVEAHDVAPDRRLQPERIGDVGQRAGLDDHVAGVAREQGGPGGAARSSAGCGCGGVLGAAAARIGASRMLACSRRHSAGERMGPLVMAGAMLTPRAPSRSRTSLVPRVAASR